MAESPPWCCTSPNKRESSFEQLFHLGLGTLKLGIWSLKLRFARFDVNPSCFVGAGMILDEVPFPVARRQDLHTDHKAVPGRGDVRNKQEKKQVRR